jgi:DNA-binding transcriptional regulator YiaG
VTDKIDEAYVKALADPLVRYMGEPPHDPLTVLALAVRAALFEAWEMIDIGEIGLKRAEGGVFDTRAESLPFEMECHGRIYTGTKVIRRVRECLDLLRPGPGATPGERVLAARGPKYMTRQDLAFVAGVDSSHVSRVERGERRLTPAMAARLAAALDVTPEYLLTGEEPNNGS